jgi:hypothetical protein
MFVRLVRGVQKRSVQTSGVVNEVFARLVRGVRKCAGLSPGCSQGSGGELAPESHIHIEVPVFFRFPLAIPGQPERLSSLKRSRSISCLPPPRPLFAPQATVSSRQPCGFSRASSVLHRSRPILSALPFITLSSRKPFRVHAHIHFFLSASFSPSPFLSLHPAFCHLH